MLPGVIGTIQANEALKIIVGYGEPLVGRLLTFDAQQTEFGTLRLKRDSKCATCGNGIDLSTTVEPASVAASGSDGEAAASCS